MNKQIYWLAVLGCCWVGCGNQQGNKKTLGNNTTNEGAVYPIDTLKAYYYPLAQLKEGLVYEYAYANNLQTAYYWFFKMVEDEAGNWNLVSTRYGANYETEALTREKVYPNGMAYETYQFLVLDTPSQKDKIYPHTIIEPVSFPFEIADKKNQVYRFQSTFNLPPDLSMNYKFTRDRQFSEFLEYDYQQKKQNAIALSGYDYLVLNDTVKGGFFTLDSSAIKEIYVKDIGLVYAERQSPSTGNAAYVLKSRYPMDSFLQKIPENILPKNRFPKISK